MNSSCQFVRTARSGMQLGHRHSSLIFFGPFTPVVRPMRLLTSFMTAYRISCSVTMPIFGLSSNKAAGKSQFVFHPTAKFHVPVLGQPPPAHLPLDDALDPGSAGASTLGYHSG